MSDSFDLVMRELELQLEANDRQIRFLKLKHFKKPQRKGLKPLLRGGESLKSLLINAANKGNGVIEVEGRSFIEEGTGHSVNFGDFLIAADQVLQNGKYSSKQISVRKCVIDKCSTSDLELSASLALLEVKFPEATNFFGAQFQGKFSAQECRFGRSTCFESAAFNELDAAECEFGPHCSFAYAKVRKNVVFDSCRFGDTADFCNMDFLGNALFSACCFGSGAAFDFSQFAGVANFQRTTFGGEVSFCEVKVDDKTFFDQLRTGTAFKISGCCFCKDFSANNSRFGSAIIDAAEFRGQAKFIRTSFQSSSRISAANSGNELQFIESDLRKLDLGRCAKPLHLEGCRTKTSSFTPPLGLHNRHGGWSTSIITLIGAIFCSIFAFSHSWITWSNTRALGELQILTRASYLSLLLVPLLAFLMPILGPAYDQITRHFESFNNHSQPLESLSNNADHHFRNALSVPLANQAFGDAGKPTIVPLPNTFALAFFSGLFVVLGHAVYQAYVPSLVRNQKLEDFKNDARANFVRNPSERFDLLRQSIFHIRSFARTMNSNPSLIARDGQSIWVPENALLLTGHVNENTHQSTIVLPISPEPQEQKPHPNSEYLKMDKSLMIVGEGATAKYQNEARIRPLAIAVCSLFYLGAIGMIMALVAYQALRVADAACWEFTRSFVEYWPDAVPNAVARSKQ